MKRILFASESFFSTLASFRFLGFRLCVAENMGTFFLLLLKRRNFSMFFGLFEKGPINE